MEQKLTPLELARQTLIQLSKSQSPPTPENYRRVYDEISGTKSADSAHLLKMALQNVLADLGKDDVKIASASKKLISSLEKQDLANSELALKFLMSKNAAISGDANWGTLLRYLLKQLEANHSGLTLSRKKEGLNRVIINFSSNPEVLAQKIQALVTSWGDGKAGIEVSGTGKTEEISSTDVPANAQVASIVVTEPSSTIEDNKKLLAMTWREMLVRTIELIVVPQFAEVPQATKRIKTLIADAKKAETLEEVNKLNEALKSTLLRAEMQLDSQFRMRDALIQILRLIVSSMGELTVEDKWLQGQLAIVKDIISKPLNLDTVYSAESSLKELIFKQSNIKPGLLAAKDTLRNMVSSFVSRLADITTSTGTYQSKVQHYYDQINSTEDIAELSTILEHLASDIGVMNEEAKQTHTALQDTQKKVEDAEKQITELTVKLDYISEVAHEDFLTGALNRRGMDEAIEREFERADKHNLPLSLAMLDIDHFKKINDSFGHVTGDKALTHLAKVVKGILRSTDVLARYGGEEFVILLPGTKEDDAINVLVGLQRELTKNFFMANNNHVVITFSAGVSERAHGEHVDVVLPRADAALYKAKQAGRNRVFGAKTALSINKDSEL